MDNLSKEEYYYIKEHKDENKVLTGFVGFGCSFGGKWFGGYARNRVGRNYCLEAKKHTMKQRAQFFVEFYSKKCYIIFLRKILKKGKQLQ